MGCKGGTQSTLASYACGIVGQIHYKQKDWPSWEALTIGSYNVIAEPLVPPENVLLPPLHIKFALMKNFVKALNKEGQAFKYLLQKFPQVSDAKLHAGAFDGPKIRTQLKDKDFDIKMIGIERDAWRTFSTVIEGFLGNKRSSEYVSHVS